MYSKMIDEFITVMKLPMFNRYLKLQNRIIKNIIKKKTFISAYNVVLYAYTRREINYNLIDREHFFNSFVLYNKGVCVCVCGTGVMQFV